MLVTHSLHGHGWCRWYSSEVCFCLAFEMGEAGLFVDQRGSFCIHTIVFAQHSLLRLSRGRTTSVMWPIATSCSGSEACFSFGHQSLIFVLYLTKNNCKTHEAFLVNILSSFSAQINKFWFVFTWVSVCAEVHLSWNLNCQCSPQYENCVYVCVWESVCVSVSLCVCIYYWECFFRNNLLWISWIHLFVFCRDGIFFLLSVCSLIPSQKFGKVEMK